MSKKFTTSLLLSTSIGVIGYFGYTSYTNHKKTNPASSQEANIMLAKNTQPELDMDLNNIDPIDTFAEPTLITQEETPQPITLTHAAPQEPEALSKEPEEEYSAPMATERPNPEKVAEIQKTSLPVKKENTPSKQERLDKFAKNMEDIQKQAEDEWSKMSSAEREEAEQQVAIFQDNFQNEIERLSQLSPEEVEREKYEAMAKLEQENPEAYQAVKSMEEMFMGLADAAD